MLVALPMPNPAAALRGPVPRSFADRPLLPAFSIRTSKTPSTKKARLKTRAAASMPMSHAANVLKRIQEDRDGTFCDLTIVSGQLQLGVHRNIVCAQSPVIHAACLERWKGTSAARFEVKEWSSELVRRMIDYIYTGDYDDLSAEANEEVYIREKDGPCFSDLMVLHATMASLADMYLVDGMRKLAESRFACTLQRTTEACQLLDSVQDVYALEAEACKTFRRSIILRMRLLTAGGSIDGILTYTREIMAKVPQFALDLATSFLQEPVLGHCSMCGKDEVVPVQPLQCRCQRCHRGGATILKQRSGCT